MELVLNCAGMYCYNNEGVFETSSTEGLDFLIFDGCVSWTCRVLGRKSPGLWLRV